MAYHVIGHSRATDLSDVKKTIVLLASSGYFADGVRSVVITWPTTQSISSVASPTGPRADLPQKPSPQESGAWM